LRVEEPSLLSDIASEPDLAGIRLIAEPWDAAGAYMLGKSFPSLRWRQWNDRFRDDMRVFVRGDPGAAVAAATRLYGSDDVFPDTPTYAFHPWQGINYVTCHDGFTLYDVVSYAEKRNAPNGHDNKDGAGTNFSWNCGAEGDEGASSATIELRKRHVKTFCCLLMLANGTPMLRMGDELLQTQGGNNNPYNQDNETSWLDWRRREAFADVFRFWCQMIRLRRAHPSVGRSRFWRADVEWQGVDTPAGCISYVLRGAAEEDDDLFVAINCSPLPHDLPIPAGRSWRRLVDTARPSPTDVDLDGVPEPVTSAHLRLEAHAVVVLICPREI
jgi:glycogen operon protein